jgi:Helicase conserved C-terminal domain/SNF2-related domain
VTLPYDFKVAPYPYQLKVWEESKDKKNWAYFLEMGLGKAMLMINVAAYLYEAGKIDAVVYFSKKGEIGAFYQYELPTHFPDRLKYEALLYSSLKVKTPKFLQQFEQLLRLDKTRLPIFVVNIEALIYGADAFLGKFYAVHRRVFLLVDESTAVKNYDRGRSRQVYHWARKSVGRRIATGSAVTNSPTDLFGQCLVFGWEMLGFKSYYAFRNTYCQIETQFLGNRRYPKVVGYKNLDQLTSEIKRFSHILHKADVLKELPAKIYTRRVVPLTPVQEKLYAKLRDEAMIELQGHELEVTAVLAQIIKLHQIVCGQLKVGPDDYVSIENNRLDVLVDLLEGYEGKVVIWTTYRQTVTDVVARLRQEFGEKSTVHFYGNTSDKERVENVYRFRGWRLLDDGARQECPTEEQATYMVASEAGAYGQTWVEAHLVIFYSNSYKLIVREQSEDRTHRIGQTVPVTYVDLISLDTVEERIVQVLREKKKLADIILERPIMEWI